jgi:ADP-ribose pyrophosphatase
VAAIRELEEETGYRARSMKPVFGGSTSPGVTDDQNTICIAKGLRRIDDLRQDREFPDGTRRHRHVRGVMGESEKLVVWEVPIQRVSAWLNRKRSSGKVIDLRIYAGLYFLEQVR